VIPISSMDVSIPWLPLDTSALPGVYYLGFTVGDPPFDNAQVRQAFGHAVDRSVIVELVDRYLPEYGAQAATSFTPPQTLGRDLTGEVGLPFDPDRALELLSAAGYTDPSAIPPVTIFVRSVGEYPGLPQRMAEAVAGMWRETLGVEVIVEAPTTRYADRFASNPPGVYRLGWLADFNDPDNFLRDIFGTGSGVNYGGWSNAEFQLLITQAHSVTDPELRQRLYIQAERILCETEAAVIPLFHVSVNPP